MSICVTMCENCQIYGKIDKYVKARNSYKNMDTLVILKEVAG